jgi:hypothetical protein
MEQKMPKWGTVLMAAVIAVWVGVWVPPAAAQLVERTGQTTSYAAGDDGDIQAGVAFPARRFRDNGDGTVTDSLTRLIWLQNANCFSIQTWQNALNAANNLADDPASTTTNLADDPASTTTNLADDPASTTTDCGLRDGSDAGDWRLPNVKELLSLLDYGNLNPALPTGHPFLNVQSPIYWSSTTAAAFPGFAWIVNLNGGRTIDDGKDNTVFVWPVRGGH